MRLPCDVGAGRCNTGWEGMRGFGACGAWCGADGWRGTADAGAPAGCGLACGARGGWARVGRGADGGWWELAGLPEQHEVEQACEDRGEQGVECRREFTA